MFDDLVQFIQNIYKTTGLILLHKPLFIANEKKYLNECIDSKFVDQFEEKIADYLGITFNIAISNGASALYVALLLAQLENLESFLLKKRKLALAYTEFFNDTAYNFVKESIDSHSNYWPNSTILKDKQQRDLFLGEINSKGVMTRLIWALTKKLTMFKGDQCGKLTNENWLEKRVVNIPSSLVIS